MPEICKECEKENCGNHPWYIVARSYSHTDKRKLVKIITRRMKSKIDAESWMEFERSMFMTSKVKDRVKKRTRFFILTVDHKDWQL